MESQVVVWDFFHQQYLGDLVGYVVKTPGGLIEHELI